MGNLIVILGDQLSSTISSLKDSNPAKDTVLMVEVMSEATYVRHHKKKIAFLFSAMRHFDEDLRAKGYSVVYTKLDDPNNTGSLKAEVARFLKTQPVDRLIFTQPGEYRVLQDIQQWQAGLGIPIEIREDDRFLCSPETFERWAHCRKELRMEFFYREMRKKYRILMDGDTPIGGKWNYDADNRKLPKDGLLIPKPYQGAHDQITLEVMKLVDKRFADHFGALEPFYFAVTREAALCVLAQFIDERLIHFGDYQDAMLEGEPWMYHAHISFYLNCGLLLPLECVEAAENAYHANSAPLNAVEGFIRQIVGWREFIRGIYWHKMPEYAHENFLKATRPLPDFYWSGDTRMNCLQQCVRETQENAYAHHIQRLMVLGNFALLAGLDPAEVNEWFLIVYADAYEWVEMPNVTGMILYADGGYLASKPYAAGGAYINKMSNYCKNCCYKVAQKNGAEACPFNYLYWDFLIRHREKLRKNPRIGMMYRTLDRMGEVKYQAIIEDSQRFLEAMDQREKV